MKKVIIIWKDESIPARLGDYFPREMDSGRPFKCGEYQEIHQSHSIMTSAIKY
jgi:hypothetical protein